jgi:glycosyltransferase involved in cell wall biosynthesis
MHFYGQNAPSIIRRGKKISVLIPSYNHESYIEDAINSVLCQDWPDIELLVLDDGSTDDTVRRAEQAVANEKKVHCSVSVQENVGASNTLNRLMSNATGDVIAVLNSDDVYRSSRLREMMEFVGGASCMFAFSAVEFKESGDTGDFHTVDDWYKEILTNASALPTAGFAMLQQNIAISTSNFLFSRDLIEKSGGFDPDLPLTSDWDFALRCVPYVEPTFIPQKLLSYRMHPENTWRKLNSQRIDQSRAVLKNFFSRPQVRENILAPFPNLWPHFYPLFLGVGRQVASDVSIGLLLRNMNLEQNSGSTHYESAEEFERLAVCRLLEAASGRDLVASSASLLELIATHWSQLRR